MGNCAGTKKDSKELSRVKRSSSKSKSKIKKP